MNLLKSLQTRYGGMREEACKGSKMSKSGEIRRVKLFAASKGPQVMTSGANPLSTCVELLQYQPCLLWP